jgi:peptidoglycan hydrolase-like protein with peptidoglycan-binding domain
MAIAADYAWARPTPTRLRSLGASAAIRYVSNETSKNLSLSEYAALKKNGFAVGLVWEASAGAALKGYSQGVSDARKANTQADSLKYPKTAAIYYAVDIDDAPSDLPAIREYFRGVNDGSPRKFGVYGSYSVMQGVTADYYWQTSAWSAGKLSPRRNLYQHVYLSDVDLNDIVKADWGQDSSPVKPPTQPAFPLASGGYFGAGGTLSDHNLDDWQRQMVARGWNLSVDGAYGPQTKSVATDFQQEKGLSVDGLIGKETWDKAWTAPVS